MMGRLETAINRFARACNVDVKDIDIIRVRQIADAMNLREDDPFLQVIAILDMYYGMYKKIPSDIRDEAHSISFEMTNKLIDSVHREAKVSSEKLVTKWIMCAVLVSCMIMSFFGMLMFFYGKESVVHRVEYVQIEQQKQSQPKLELPAPRRIDK